MHKILLGTGGQLKSLAEHCARLNRASALIEGHLPEPLRQHCRVANLADGVLVLYSDGAGWTTRLRFQAPRLLDSLRGHPEFGQLREIRVKPSPSTPPAGAAPERIAHLPAPVADHLLAAASGIDAPALRAALRRLAGRGRPPG